MRSVVVALIPIIALLVSRTIHFNNVLLLLIFVVIVLSLYISGFFLFFHYARLKELNVIALLHNLHQRQHNAKLSKSLLRSVLWRIQR